MESAKYIVLVGIIAILGTGIYKVVSDGPSEQAPAEASASSAGNAPDDTSVLEAKPDAPPLQAPSPSGPPTSAGDPYAAGQKALGSDEYAQSKAELLTQVRLAGSAAVCRVITDVDANVIGISGMQSLSHDEEAAGQPTYHPDLLPAVQAAEADGGKMGAEPGGCDYWQKNPDAVRQMRDLAHIATMP